MKKYYQYLGLVAIMLFSFYYTDQIATIVLNKNPLMQTINEQKNNYEVESVNAIVDGDYIIPGLNGLMVNAKDTYYNMQKLETFNEYYLVFEQVKPEVSLEKNRDKVIRQGNSLNRNIAFILEEENEISDYLLEQHIKADVLVTINSYQKNNFFEPVNNETKGFKSLENTLNLNKENKKLCLINENNIEVCKKNKNYLIEPTLTLKSNNYIDVKNNLANGSIIYISKNAHISDVKFLIKEIKFKNLNVVYLSELISEENRTN